MCALTSTLNKIYGLNTSGQVLEFSQDFHRYEDLSIMKTTREKLLDHEKGKR